MYRDFTTVCFFFSLTFSGCKSGLKEYFSSSIERSYSLQKDNFHKLYLNVILQYKLQFIISTFSTMNCTNNNLNELFEFSYHIRLILFCFPMSSIFYEFTNFYWVCFPMKQQHYTDRRSHVTQTTKHIILFYDCISYS